MNEPNALFNSWATTALRDHGFDGARAVLAMEGAALAAVAPLARDWLQRREESLAAAQRLLDRLGAATEPMAALHAEQDWWTGAVERMTQDASAWTQFGMALMRVPSAGVSSAASPQPAAPGPRVRRPEVVAA